MSWQWRRFSSLSWSRWILEIFWSDDINGTCENILGADFKNNYTTKQKFPQEYSCFLVWSVLFGPIGREKQNSSSFLLVEIKLFIKKTSIFLMKLLFCCLIVLKSAPVIMVGIHIFEHNSRKQARNPKTSFKWNSSAVCGQIDQSVSK